MPGIGKTTLALGLARILGLRFGRIQFTSDLLPADVLGTSIYRREREEFEFRPGPVFRQVVLADEINRATPKTQSALLEAMAEGQLSIEGRTYRLPRPFFVIATQNPIEHHGTYPLPESQLDRFLMSLRVDYPGRDAERRLLRREGGRPLVERLEAVLDPEGLRTLQDRADQVRVEDPLLEYALDLAWATRRSERLSLGVSPRGVEMLVSAARAWAFLEGRAYVIPEDVQAVAPAVLRHRILPRGDYAVVRREQIVEEFLAETPIP